MFSLSLKTSYCNHPLLAVNGLVSFVSQDPLLKSSYRLNAFQHNMLPSIRTHFLFMFFTHKFNAFSIFHPQIQRLFSLSPTNLMPFLSIHCGCNFCSFVVIYMVPKKCTYICVYMSVYAYINIYTLMYASINTYLFICVCVYIHLLSASWDGKNQNLGGTQTYH